MDEEAGGSCHESESEASEEEGSGGVPSPEASGEEEESREEAKASSSGRKKRKRKASAGHRRKIRRRYDSVEDFNPAARSAHTEELERIRRLELQQSLGDTSPPEGTETGVTGPGEGEEGALIGDDVDRSPASGSPDLMLVDLTEAEVAEEERARAEAIVIGSSSDSESGEDSRTSQKARGKGAQPQGTAKAVKRGAKRLNRKYDVIEPHPDGKVLVNVGHPPEEGDVFLAPQIAGAAKPHQVGGIRFLYDNIVESLTRYPISTGFGCILAHSMGLGKTLQVIGFIDIFLRHTPGRLVLCVVPVNTLQNWIAEFDKWLPEVEAAKDKKKKKRSLLGEKSRKKKSPSPMNSSSSQPLRLSRASPPQPLSTQAVSSLGQSVPQGGGGGEEGQRATELVSADCPPSSSRLQALLAPTNRGSSPSPLQRTGGAQTPPTASSTSTTMLAGQLHIAGPQAPFNERLRFPNSPYQASAGSSRQGSPCDLKDLAGSGDSQHSLAEPRTSCETQNPSPLEGGASGRGLDGPSPEPEVIFRSFQLFVLCESSKTMESRLALISQWRKEGGVLLMGYELYRLLSLSVPSLAGNKMALRRKKSAKKAESGSNTIDLDENEREMDQLIEIQQALCHPGPDLVVCDEGHRIKNDYSNISQALKKIGTRRRIVMTGYPLQNNLMEYWCMVDFVRPNYLGKKQEFADLFERPISNGQCTDSTPSDVRLMRYRSHVLHALMEGFVLRRGHEILKATLLPKFEHVLYLRPSEAQAALYNYFMDQFLEGGTVSSPAGPLRAFAVCSKIWNHPDIYYNEAMAQESKRASPTSWLDEAGLPKSLLSGSASSKNEPTSLCKIDWPAPLLPAYKPGLLSNSLKMVITMELVDRAVQVGDRLLIFSQSLSTLSYTEKLLSQRHIPIPNTAGTNRAIQYSDQKWTKNKNYCRLDGSTSSIERDRLINNFNSPRNKECWLFLLSTRAGCLGVNLVGANRVIVMDVSWNPCYDSQAVCRVYRYGQEKACYIYRLVCDGTMERKIFDRQISKQGMAVRVIDELHPERHFTTNDIYTLMAKLTPLPAPKDLSSSANEFLFDPVLMQLCKTLGPLFTKLPLKHESLLLVSEDERMTEVEKYVAMKGFQQHLTALRYQAASQAQTYRSQQLVASGQNQQRPQVQQLPQQQQVFASSSGGLRAAVPNVRVAAVRSPLPPSSQKNLPQAATPHASLASTQNLPKLPASAVSPIPAPQASGSDHNNSKYDGVEVICLDSDSEDEGSSCNTSSTVSATSLRPNQLAQYTPANLLPQSAITVTQSSGILLPGPRVISAPITGGPPFSSSLSSTIADILAAAKAGGGSSDARMRAALIHTLAEAQAQNSGSGNQLQSFRKAQTASQAQHSGSGTQIWNSAMAQTSRPTAIAPSLSGVTTPQNSRTSTASSFQKEQQSSPNLPPVLPSLQAAPATVAQGVLAVAPSPSRSPVRSQASTTSSISAAHQTHAPTIIKLQTLGDSRITQQQPANVTTTSLDISPKLQQILPSTRATHQQATSVSTTSLDKHPSLTVFQQQASTTHLDRSPRQQTLASPQQLASTTLLDRSPRQQMLPSPQQQASTTLLDRSPRQQMLPSPTVSQQQASTTILDRSPRQQILPSPMASQQQASTTLLDRSPRQQMLPSPQQQVSTTLLDRSPRQQILHSPTVSQQQASTTLLDRSPRQQMLPSPTVSQQQASTTLLDRSPRQQMLPSPTVSQQQASTTLLDRSPRQQILHSPTVSQQQATSVQSSPLDRSPRQQMLPSPKSPSSTQLLSPPTPRAGLSPTGNNRRTSPTWSTQPPDSNYDPSSIPLLSPVAARLFQLSQARDSVSRSVSPSPTSTPSPSLSSSSSLPLPSLAPLSGKRTAIVPPYSAIPNSNQPSPPPLHYQGKTSLPQQALSSGPHGGSSTPQELAPAASNSIQTSSGSRPKAAFILDLTGD